MKIKGFSLRLDIPGFNASLSSQGLNISQTIETELGKINVPLCGRRKKAQLTTNAGGFVKKTTL